MEVWDSKVDDRMVVALGTGLFTNDIWHNLVKIGELMYTSLSFQLRNSSKVPELARGHVTVTR
jgi:hypothetical protein